MRKIALLTIPLLVLGLFSLSADEMEMMGPTVNSPVEVEVQRQRNVDVGNRSGVERHRLQECVRE